VYGWLVSGGGVLAWLAGSRPGVLEGGRGGEPVFVNPPPQPKRVTHCRAKSGPTGGGRFADARWARRRVETLVAAVRAGSAGNEVCNAIRAETSSICQLDREMSEMSPAELLGRYGAKMADLYAQALAKMAAGPAASP
jgi:hypothetical protein